MAIYRKTAQLAREFDAVYPADLADRLQWWGTALGIDRDRLLRLIGMTARQAARRKGEDLKEVLQSPEWQENAWLVEGALHRLLALFHYDWHALAERIHGPAGRTAGSSRITRRVGEVPHPPDTPNGDAGELLVDRLAAGGPQSLLTVLEYLAAAPTAATRDES